LPAPFVYSSLSAPSIIKECKPQDHPKIILGPEVDVFDPRYQFRDSQKPHLQKMQQETREDFDKLLRARMNEAGLAGKRPEGWMDWIYKNNIEKVWEEYLQAEKKRATSK
jgi:hypothetical protein